MFAHVSVISHLYPSYFEPESGKAWERLLRVTLLRKRRCLMEESTNLREYIYLQNLPQTQPFHSGKAQCYTSDSKGESSLSNQLLPRSYADLVNWEKRNYKRREDVSRTCPNSVLRISRELSTRYSSWKNLRCWWFSRGTKITAQAYDWHRRFRNKETSTKDF